MPASIDYDLPASGNAGFSCQLVGLGRTPGNAEVCTTPTAETTTGIMAAINGKMYVNGTEVKITSLKISIKNNAAGTGAEVGSNDSGDVSREDIMVEGSFVANLRDSVITALYEAETEINICSVLTADQTATSEFKAFSIGAVKVGGDAPNDGKKEIYRTYPFTARINSAGGAALAWDETIITLQDSAA